MKQSLEVHLPESELKDRQKNIREEINNLLLTSKRAGGIENTTEVHVEHGNMVSG